MHNESGWDTQESGRKKRNQGRKQTLWQAVALAEREGDEDVCQIGQV